MTQRLPPSTVVPVVGGVVLTAMAVVVATSDLPPGTRRLSISLYVALGLALAVAVTIDRRRANKRRRRTLTLTPRMRVVAGSRKHVDGFLSICDPATMGNLGWTDTDVIKMVAQIESGRGNARLVLERKSGAVIGCVIMGPVGHGFVLVGWIGAQHRRHGYGSELLDRICADAFAAGSRSVLVGLPTADPGLVPFIEQHEFVAAGTHQLLGLHDDLIDTLTYRRTPPGKAPPAEAPPVASAV